MNSDSTIGDYKVIPLDRMLGEEVVSGEGVLKMNCKVLDSAQLKKLDKQEKILAHDIHSTGKGESKHPFLLSQKYFIVTFD